ncbi:MAG: RNA polymerase sigma factor [Crocosphaera sp.]|jgi:RNA polymerase sigma factor (sigma-70 family)
MILPKSRQFEAVSQNDDRYFWQLWESHQDCFEKCCLKWMGGNYSYAEDVLNQAMVKAWNKWTKSANGIKNPKGWLMRIIYNCCMDSHRKRKRETRLIDNIDNLDLDNVSGFYSRKSLPEDNILQQEFRAYLRQQIESLPDRIRHTFILHFYQEKSAQDIAKQLALSEDNIRKQIQQARKILQKQLNKYLEGEDKTFLDFLPPSLKKDIPMEETYQFNDIVTSNLESSITTKIKHEEINYHVTLICLEKLPHLWYNSPNSLGWR